MEQWTTCYEPPREPQEICSNFTTRERFRVKESIYPTQHRLQQYNTVPSSTVLVVADKRNEVSLILLLFSVGISEV